MDITKKNIFILMLLVMIGLGLLDSFLYFFDINLHLESIGVTLLFLYVAIKSQYDIIKSSKASGSNLLKDIILPSLILWFFMLIFLKINLT